jgi:hypothetical protein
VDSDDRLQEVDEPGIGDESCPCGGKLRYTDWEDEFDGGTADCGVRVLGVLQGRGKVQSAEREVWAWEQEEVVVGGFGEGLYVVC